MMFLFGRTCYDRSTDTAIVEPRERVTGVKITAAIFTFYAYEINEIDELIFQSTPRRNTSSGSTLLQYVWTVRYSVGLAIDRLPTPPVFSTVHSIYIGFTRSGVFRVRLPRLFSPCYR